MATPEGEVAVEALVPGTDLVLADGGTGRLRWTARRAVLPANMPDARRAVWPPVRIRRGAIAPGVPSRDVLVSASLGIRLPRVLMPTGALVPAAALVNGRSILREPEDAPCRYAQPELERHAVLLAAGLEVESLADRSDRSSFANVLDAPTPRGPAPALPRASEAACAAGRNACAPVEAGPFSRNPDLRLLVDGVVVSPDSVGKGLHRFSFTGPVQEIRLLSRSLVPAAQIAGSSDKRRLGVSLWSIRLLAEGAAVEFRFDHPSLAEGFHAVETGARWTDGFALLPSRLYGFLAGPITLEGQIGDPDIRYPLPPEESRPRALVLDEAVPTPDRDAGSNVILEHIRLLRGLGYAVTFMPANLSPGDAYGAALEAAGVELAVHPFYGGLEHFLASRGPSFALAYVHRVSVADRAIPVLRRLAPQLRILFNNADLHFLRVGREADVTGNQALLAEAGDLRQRELRAIAAADATLLCNAQEMQLLRAELPTARLIYLPWVIGPRRRDEAGFEDRRGIMFLGGFAHRPNADAVIWLVTEVMPLLRRLVPGLKLHVYGHGIPERVGALAAADVIIEGHVADLGAAFARHRLSVAPLRFGAGFKGKLAESLAHGVPVVATSIAVEGTGLVGGAQLLLADGAEAFALAVAGLHETPALWRDLADRGRQFTLSTFSAAAGRERMRAALSLAGLPASP